MDSISKDEAYRKSILRPTISHFFSKKLKLGSKYRKIEIRTSLKRFKTILFPHYSDRGVNANSSSNSYEDPNQVVIT